MALRPLSSVPEKLKAIMSKYGRDYSDICIFVETGIWKGELTEVVAGLFERVIAVELSEFYLNYTKERLAKINNIEFHHGDSATVLPTLAKRIVLPTVFYLDAHYCDTGTPKIDKCKFPLWDELEAIREHRNHSDIVIVDDAHNFGKDRADLKFAPEDREWESVTMHSIAEALGDRVRGVEVHDDICVVYMTGENKL